MSCLDQCCERVAYPLGAVDAQVSALEVGSPASCDPLGLVREQFGYACDEPLGRVEDRLFAAPEVVRDDDARRLGE